jgi:hypothetical protein
MGICSSIARFIYHSNRMDLIQINAIDSGRLQGKRHLADASRLFGNAAVANVAKTNI